MELSAPEQNAGNAPLHPFLARSSIPRNGDPTIPGHYCHERRVWVVETTEGLAPIVSTHHRAAELATKTDAVQEKDDPGRDPMIELITKTASQLEGDDERVRTSYLLELSTKTESVTERDD